MKIAPLEPFTSRPDIGTIREEYSSPLRCMNMTPAIAARRILALCDEVDEQAADIERLTDNVKYVGEDRDQLSTLANEQREQIRDLQHTILDQAETIERMQGEPVLKPGTTVPFPTAYVRETLKPELFNPTNSWLRIKIEQACDALDAERAKR